MAALSNGMAYVCFWIIRNMTAIYISKVPRIMFLMGTYDFKWQIISLISNL